MTPSGASSLAHAERLGDGIAHPLVIPRTGFQAVHHQLDEMGLVAVQGLHGLQFEDFPVDPDFGVTPLPELVEQLAVGRTIYIL